MKHTYIIEYNNKPVIIISLDYGEDSEIFEEKYENYHGRTYKFLRLTTKGLLKVENALGYQIQNSDLSIKELTPLDITNKIQSINSEIEKLGHVKAIYESWLNDTSNNTYFIL